MKKSGVPLMKTYRPEYRAWESAKSRCFTPTCPKYPRYGGRGITMCQRWREDFMAFLMDVGRRPSPEHSIDRIDNDGDYEPGNVKWSTRAEQQSNMARNRHLTLEGRTQTLSQWSRELGIPKSTISTRLANGASDEEALSTVGDGHGFQTSEEIAEETGLPVGLFERRRAAGWSIDDAACIPEGMTRKEYGLLSSMESSLDRVVESSHEDDLHRIGTDHPARGRKPGVETTEDQPDTSGDGLAQARSHEGQVDRSPRQGSVGHSQVRGD